MMPQIALAVLCLLTGLSVGLRVGRMTTLGDNERCEAAVIDSDGIWPMPRRCALAAIDIVGARDSSSTPIDLHLCGVHSGRIRADGVIVRIKAIEVGLTRSVVHSERVTIDQEAR